MRNQYWVALTAAFGMAASASAWALADTPKESTQLKHPIELCQKLAGIERELCNRQAQQNPPESAIGSTPGTVGGGEISGGSKSNDDKRGNTPPGTSRAGDPPAAGAIVDPAGVTKR